MDQSLYKAAAGLDAADARQLYALATSPGEPAALAHRLRWGLLLVAGLLLASGLIFWIAANWQEQTRMFKLGLIEAALALSIAAACLWPRARLAALLCAHLVLGGLLAFVGQTYQTGADAWQLFATWAALSLLWTLIARSDLLWTLWMLVGAMGLASWQGRIHGLDLLLSDPEPLSVVVPQMLLWLGLALVPWLVSRLRGIACARGLGRISHRLGLALVLMIWCTYGVSHWFHEARGFVVFAMACALTAGTAYLSLQSRLQDFPSLCLATLAANVLAMSALLRVIEFHDVAGALFLCLMLGLAGLWASVTGLLAAQRRMRAQAWAREKEEAA
ncbi:DUF2157 domain-containing protein [Comamonas composti]|uniref:DUF2157 domain-containing protein n=1 Tax=Comamonas composti TaxID=408558 RepID=UPI0004173472|nr:DUF2157 domain-containing protein [Comamonas composti]